MSKSIIRNLYNSVIKDDLEGFKQKLNEFHKPLDKILINSTEKVTILHLLGNPDLYTII